ncbi:MAG TPA: tellurite resistance/C4-dicarboxylate transporter family protein [Segeticoccus sp.]|uniref:tellurite resistance/C4-dicarboxylate transporter family protein n=1 Tax=Segeticoccus sp. TaxID=2706531 RepID=UPI002D7FA2D3|nr:tellurite resistance/C4-dicarboxylate transporter family protein [Segeticoccus sp.]HET8600937.1 tellurite resistance/C4-dicarboxylate transporter family protein [Segeticoccus sp.]
MEGRTDPAAAAGSGSAAGPASASARVSAAVRSLAPGYFALVMASGIISIGLETTGFGIASAVFLAVCAIAFVVLCVLTVVRVARYRQAVVAEFTDPRKDFGFFTFVAGANVLGSRLAMNGLFTWTAVLFVMGSLGWLVLGYVVPWTVAIGRQQRPLIATANGTWFDWVVSSQSVAIAATALAPAAGSARTGVALLAVVAWSVGIFLYAAAGVFVALRLMLYPVGPRDLPASYWVAMGSCAITVVAGAEIVQMPAAPVLETERSLIAGLSLLFWAFATYLIPALVAAGWWRHVVRKVPLTYDAGLWSMVFPVGMYGVSCLSIGTADRLPIVHQIGTGELWFAVLVWALVFAAMAVHFVRTVVVGPRRLRAG